MTTVPTMASSMEPELAAIPIEATTHKPAAVVRPLTKVPSRKIAPAPRKPTPVAIWAVIRDWSGTSNPMIETIENTAAPTPTRLMVRNLAALRADSRS